MAEVTDEELAEKRQYVKDLRTKIQEQEGQRAERQASAQNEIAAAQLDAEAARLEARLETVEESSSADSIQEGASGPLGQAKEQLAAAQTQAEMPVGPVDTNVGAEESSDESNS